MQGTRGAERSRRRRPHFKTSSLCERIIVDSRIGVVKDLISNGVAVCPKVGKELPSKVYGYSTSYKGSLVSIDIGFREVDANDFFNNYIKIDGRDLI